MRTKIFILFTSIICLSLCLSSPAFSQEEDVSQKLDFQPTSIYLELGGNSFLYSLNIDYRLSRQISLRGGITAIPLIFSGGFIFTAPVMINYLVGNDRHFLKIGLGVLLGPSRDRDMFFNEGTNSLVGVIPTMTIGYRYQKIEGSILFRAGLTPFFNFSHEVLQTFTPTAGLSIGYTFKSKNQ